VKNILVNIHKAIFFTTMIVVMTGCTFIPISTIPATVNSENDVKSTPTKLIENSTATMLPPTSSPGGMAVNCVEIMSENLPDGSLVGTLVVNNLNADSHDYLLNLMDDKKSSLGRILNETISPDGSKLAYYDLDKKSVVVSDSIGNKLTEIPDLEERLTPSYWLNDHQLGMDYRRSEWGGPFEVPATLVLNLKNNQKELLEPNYPNIDNYFSNVSWKTGSRFILNASLTNMVYQARDKWLWIVMFDLVNNKEVGKLFNGSNENTPWWSADGTRIVTSAPPVDTYEGVTYNNADDGLPYVKGTDLFTMDVNGKINRLTYFTTTAFALQNSYTWSPDDKKIAFFLRVSDDNKNIANAPPELSIVDTLQRKVSNYCISGHSLVWSPDGKYIIINQGPNERENISKAYLIDLESRKAWKIVENAEVRGWMGLKK
jgi:Tol biopolymer transport system component